jgi:hypothetical protein
VHPFAFTPKAGRLQTAYCVAALLADLPWRVRGMIFAYVPDGLTAVGIGKSFAFFVHITLLYEFA